MIVDVQVFLLTNLLLSLLLKINKNLLKAETSIRRSISLKTRNLDLVGVLLFGSPKRTTVDWNLKVSLYQNEAEIPVGGSSEIFSGKLKQNNRRSMGSFNNSRGIQTGVHRETSSIENKENFSFFKRYTNFTSRSKHFIRKRCNRTSTESRETNRFL